jgi:hypothetical protein
VLELAADALSALKIPEANSTEAPVPTLSLDERATAFESSAAEYYKALDVTMNAYTIVGHTLNHPWHNRTSNSPSEIRSKSLENLEYRLEYCSTTQALPHPGLDRSDWAVYPSQRLKATKKTMA